MLISPDGLVKKGYLTAESVKTVPPFPEKAVDYGPVIEYKQALLRESYEHFKASGTAEQKAAYQQFCTGQADWLEDFALFMALKNHHKDIEGGVWNTWPTDIAQRQPEAMQRWSVDLADEVAHQKYLQFLFFEQWLALKAYANARQIRIIGDAPIFVAFDSADAWSNPELFYLDEDGAPTVIAGVPPDYFSETGQRWGNPLYRWDVMKANQYAWWRRRLEMIFTQVDVVRIDHFRGFEAYWEIPAEEPTAIVGQWVKGPGPDLFRVIVEKLGDLPIIAEDLGVITPEVEALRDEFNFPGMKILQFAFGGERNSNFLPHSYGRNSVVYTGTHDNETTVGWYRNAEPFEQDHIRRYVARDGSDIAWDMIRLAYASVADTAVIPLQDHMSLGNEARMNFPGKVGGYWRWRYLPFQLTDIISQRLRELTELYGRSPEPEEVED
jgi:4-alpha-glucanotransferase